VDSKADGRRQIEEKREEFRPVKPEK